MKSMYSSEWFDTFAATVPASIIDAELAGIASVLPMEQYQRVLDIGCGIGRIAGPLSLRGYAVTGVDIHVDALRKAHRSSPRPHYVALDQRHIGRLRWVFDAALVLWNSLGFVGRTVDRDTLAGCAAVLRPGGKVILDLYHPKWLERHQRAGERDARGPVIRRWVHGGRCFHEIRYASGRIDAIQFEIYHRHELRDLAQQAGFEPLVEMASWQPGLLPDAELPRYQLVCVRA
jgi:SAM-dependent methyltransferase